MRAHDVAQEALVERRGRRIRQDGRKPKEQGPVPERAAAGRAASDQAANSDTATGRHDEATPLEVPRARILLSPPDVGAREREALLQAFDSNWISTVGPAITDFERAMEARLGRPCVALSSGTAALHLALRMAGVRAGDVVMCQSLTFVASANPILYEGAEPCFVDSEGMSWNMDPDLLEEGIRRQRQRGKRVAAVITVHLYGVPAAVERIAKVCARNEVPLIEDAAEALGAGVAGAGVAGAGVASATGVIGEDAAGSLADLARATSSDHTGPVNAGALPGGYVPVGVHGMAAVFSFNGNKILTTAGGGMLAVSSEEEAARVRKWSAQSREVAAHYEHVEPGFNYRMSNLLAGLGCAQLEGLEAKVAKRREIAQRYREGLRGLPLIRIQAEPPGSFATHWLSCARVSGNNETERLARRDGLLRYLASHGIEARPLWKPMHQQPLFRGAAQVGGAVSNRLFAEGLCLPSGSGMSVEEQDEVIARIREYLGAACLDAPCTDDGSSRGDELPATRTAGDESDSDA